MKRVGLVGLGQMGMRMAFNLIKAGYEVVGYDIDKNAIKTLADHGGKPANSLKEVAEFSDVVILMVLTYPQVKSCIIEPDTLGDYMKPGSTLIITSTIAPQEIREVSEVVSSKGINVLDSPVTGGTKGAEDGTLVMIVSGKDEVYKECEDILKTIGANAVQVGNEIGLGQVIKASVQLLVSVHLVAMAEALVLGTKAGADPEVLYDIIKKSAGNSWMLETKLPRILNGDFSNSGALDIQIKDLDIVQKIAREVNMPLFTSSVSKDVFLWGNALGYGRDDASSVIKVFEDIVGVKVRNHQVKEVK
ncbi:NAD(P)-dependent oxidoreductase [Alkalihalobacillus oceani]|nr:NAD(P)-dependent oxidoreductase [Halalkalibacter oceani]